MQILVISPQPLFQPRGTPFSVFNRTKALSSLGHKIDVVCYHIGDNFSINNTKVYRTLKLPFINNVKIGPSMTKIFLDLFVFFTCFRLLMTKKYDLIHCHEEAGFFGVIFKKIFKIPLVYDMHSSMPQQIVNFRFSKNKLFINFMKFLQRKIIHHSDVIIAICPHLVETVKKVDLTSNIVLIENLPLNNIDININENKLNNFRKKYGISDEYVLVYTGTLEHYQGIDLLLKSFSKIQEDHVKLVIVGGSESQVDFYKNMAKEFNVENKVIFTGQRPPEEMKYYIEMADILVSSRSSGTNTPLKIYTYLKSGKPILATKILSHTQVLDETISFLAEPDEIDFSKGIDYLIRNKDVRVDLANNALKIASEKYSYEQFLEKTRKAFTYFTKERES